VLAQLFEQTIDASLTASYLVLQRLSRARLTADIAALELTAKAAVVGLDEYGWAILLELYLEE
jgi:hypothetical protein